MSDLPRGIPKGYFSGSVRGKDMAPKTKPTNIQSETEVNDEDVAERIRQALENVDMTRREVADSVGVAEKVIHAWARLGQISKHNLPRFAEVTGTSLDYLLTGRSAPSIYTVKETSSTVVEFSRELSSGFTDQTTFTIRDCPVVNILDLHETLPKEDVKSTINLGQQLLTDLIEDWVKNPNTMTTVPVSIVSADDVGLPTFAMQITTNCHEPFPTLGSLIAFTTDLMPDRGDFCIMARRARNGPWTISAGFFHWNARMNPGNHREFFRRSQEEDLGVEITLAQRPDHVGIDPFTINCFEDEWLLIGVGVFYTLWMHPAHRITETLLDSRITRRFHRRDLNHD